MLNSEKHWELVPTRPLWTNLVPMAQHSPRIDHSIHGLWARLAAAYSDKSGDNMAKSHPGFKAVASKIAGEGYSKKAAGAILANATRKASPKAKKNNPKLRKVK